MNRNLIFYVLVVGIFGSLLWFVFNQGAKLQPVQSPQTSSAEANGTTTAQDSGVEATVGESAIVVFFKSLFDNVEHPLSLLLIQIIVIVASSKLLASLMRRIGQPMVV